MPTFSQAQRPDLRQARLDLGDNEFLLVEFDAKRVTPAWTAHMQREDVLTVPRALAEVIVGWDLTQDDGSEYPPTEGNLAALGFSVLGELAEALMREINPSEEEKRGSSEPSSTTTGQAESSSPPSSGSQSNTATSPSPSAAASLSTS